MSDLFIKHGRRYKPAPYEVVTKAAYRIAEAAEFRDRNCLLGSPRATKELLVPYFAGKEHEEFAVVYLDSRHRLIAMETLFRGTVDGASVHPREVVKEALRRNATAVILAHNHPSGIAEQSQADEIITTRLRDALALVEIRLLDHMIVAGTNVVSLAEKGLI